MKANNVDVARKYIQLHNSAEKRNIEFKLSFTDVRKLLNQEFCHYPGVRMIRKHGDKPPANSATVDRIVSTKGYIKGNVVMCSHEANQFKEKYLEACTGAIDVGAICKMMYAMREQSDKC